MNSGWYFILRSVNIIQEILCYFMLNMKTLQRESDSCKLIKMLLRFERYCTSFIVNTINSDYIFLDTRTSRSYLVSFSSIFRSLGGSSFSSFQKIDSSYLLACFRFRVVGISKLRIEIEKATTRK